MTEAHKREAQLYAKIDELKEELEKEPSYYVAFCRAKEEVQRLEVELAKSWKEEFETTAQALADTLEKLKLAVEVLRFYGKAANHWNRKSFNCSGFNAPMGLKKSDVAVDGGQKAREVLDKWSENEQI